MAHFARQYAPTCSSKLRSVCLSLLVAASLGLASGALAQEGDDVDEEEDDVDAELLEELEEVIVTGSRIRKSGIDADRPIISIGQEDLQKLAFTNIADALNEIPAYSAGVDPRGTVNTFTAGANFVNLFGLGTQRTLVLVDGKRFVSSNPPALFGSVPGLQVDFNAIPIALIDRIETVPMSGAAVYGSDAIAGTVNVFVRDDFEGFDITALKGYTEEGEGEDYQTAMVFGFNFDGGRGNMAMSVEANRQKALYTRDRDWLVNGDLSYEATGPKDLDGDGQNDDLNGDGRPENFRTIHQDGIVQVIGGGGGAATPTSFPLFAPAILGFGAWDDDKFYQFQDGNLEECHPAANPGTVVRVYDTDPNACGVHDFFEDSQQLLSPLERVLLTNFLTYNIHDRVVYSQSIIVSRTESGELANQGGFQTGFFDGESGSLTVPIDHPFLSEQARGVLTQANGGTAPDAFTLHRYNNDLVNTGATGINSVVVRGDFKLEGDFDVWDDRTFYWDASAVFGRADIETRSVGIIDGRFFNAVDAVRLDDAALAPILGALQRRPNMGGDLNGDDKVDSEDAIQRVISAGGSANVILQAQAQNEVPVICRVNLLTAQQGLTDEDGEDLPGPEGHNNPAAGGGLTDSNRPFSDGCTPLNLFTYGGSSRESLEFINGGPLHTTSDLRQQVFMANLTGDLFDLPAGPVSFGIGWENRVDEGSFDPDLSSIVPFTRSAPILPSGGKIEADEFYVEARVPLVSVDMDIPYLHELTLEFAARNTESKISGAGSNRETTRELRLTAKPFADWVTMRASTAHAIRIPAVVELFTPTSQTFVSDPDACDRRSTPLGNVPTTRVRNCRQHMEQLGVDDYDPATFTSNIVDGTISGGFSSGNPNLGPEVSDAWSIGIVLEPLDELTLAFDWFDIEIEDRIVFFGWDDLSAACYDDPAGFGNQFCGQFDREIGTGQVTEVRSSWLNAASSRLSISQFQGSYDLNLQDAFGWDLGTIEWYLSLTYRRFNQFQNTDTSPVSESTGGYGNPDWNGILDTIWEFHNWRIFWRILFQDKPKLSISGNLFYLNRAETEAVIKNGIPVRHNMSVRYLFNEDIALQLSIDNVLNRRPNDTEFAAGHYSFSEIIGRTFTLSARVSF